MKELINKFKKLDQTKRIVILFITISFVFIGGFSIYNGISGNYQNGNTAQVTQIKETKEKNTKENKKEERQESINQTQETSESTQSDNQSTTQSTNETKTNDESKLNSKSSTTQSNDKSSSVGQSQSSTNQSQSNSEQTSNNQSNDSSNSSSSTQQPTNEKITVSMQVIGMGNTIMSGTLNVDKGTSVYNVLTQLASQNGLSVSGNKIYVKGIGDLFEKQHGSGSGWMYSVNGEYPRSSCGYYYLENNDNVVWRYVNYE